MTSLWMPSGTILAALLTSVAALAQPTAATQRSQTFRSTSAASAEKVLSPKVRTPSGSVSADDYGLTYFGGSVLQMAESAIGQSLELLHREKWIIANGNYALWDNKLDFTVKGPTSAAREAAAEKLQAFLSKPGCLQLKDAKGASLPPFAKLVRTRERLAITWDAIAISDKSRSPKTLVLPWGTIVLIDRVDLITPSALGRIEGC